MCSSYTLKTNWKNLEFLVANTFKDLPFVNLTDKESWDERYQGYMKTQKSPIIRYLDGHLVLEDFYFSLCPSWSKVFPCEWTTYNARLDRVNKFNKSEKIFEIPTWRESFKLGQVCLVPITAAVESSYFGTHKGEIVEFSLANNQVFLASAIWAQWGSGADAKLGFSLLTDDPYPFFFKSGHDRSLVLLDKSHWQEWLLKKFNPKERFDFLKKNRVDDEFKTTVYRKMKPGWEKRAPSESEIKKIKVFGV